MNFIQKHTIRPKKLSTRLQNALEKEDLKFLQIKTNGKSVYRSLEQAYRRRPKHRGSQYSF